jgi:hypothetical protein
MWRLIGVDIAAGALLIAAWYWIFRRLNRKRGLRVLQWIERAFEGHGDVSGVEWLSASRMRVRLRLMECGFNQLSILVCLLPRETPVQWMVSRLKKFRETMTFQGDLPCAPNFNLDVHNHRWCGRSRRKLLPGKGWSLSRTGPFVLTSRPDWQRDIKTMMDAIAASRDCNFMQVQFRRASPHFTATVQLASVMLDDNATGEVGVFDALKDLAAGASASRF